MWALIIRKRMPTNLTGRKICTAKPAQANMYCEISTWKYVLRNRYRYIQDLNIISPDSLKLPKRLSVFYATDNSTSTPVHELSTPTILLLTHIAILRDTWQTCTTTRVMPNSQCTTNLLCFHCLIFRGFCLSNLRRITCSRLKENVMIWTGRKVHVSK